MIGKLISGYILNLINFNLEYICKWSHHKRPGEVKLKQRRIKAQRDWSGAMSGSEMLKNEIESDTGSGFLGIAIVIVFFFSFI